jgi:hypothetical protein
MPGDLLWEGDFTPDTTKVSIREYGEGDQAWYTPAGGYVPSDHVKIYQCDIVDIPDPFIQEMDSIYWLDISVSSEFPLGWKTADRDRYPPPYTGHHFEDDAVWSIVPLTDWEELIYPPGAFPDTGSIDLAFVITGSDTALAGVREADIRPTRYKLGQSYPNPFSSRTTIRFDAPDRGRVHVAVYDVKGQRIRVLVDAEIPAGRHTAVWDGKNESGEVVASGIYFLQMKAREFDRTKKLILLR